VTDSNSSADSPETYDLLIIGGGVNGAGIAADAAGRGLRVLVCEKADLAGATSSASTKLIHGGLRYLEHYEFRLVRKALQEREVLFNAARHIVDPIPFHIPHLPHLRPRWMIRIGLFFYDYLTRRKNFAASRALTFAADSPLIPELKKGFEYWDAQVDDSRLVVLNAMLARAKGAVVLTQTECTSLKADGDTWQASLKGKANNPVKTIHARAVVNAGGPWVSQIVESVVSTQPRLQARLVKGSHVVVPRLYPGNQSYLLQNDDGRIVFVIPYRDKFSLIGTTEEEFHGNPDLAAMSNAETDYLIAIINKYFVNQLDASQIVHRFSGIRPLVGEEGQAASKVSRDYRLEFENTRLPLLSVYGGKVTTYRVLAQDTVDQLRKYFPKMGHHWTKEAVLPGGDFQTKKQLIDDLNEKHPWLGQELVQRWVHSYGSLSYAIIGSAARIEDLGMHFGNGLYQLEVDYLCQQEWAASADDILWRRSKLGLVFNASDSEKLQAYLTDGSKAV